MRISLFYIFVGIVFLLCCTSTSCKSRKNCAQFENAEKEFHVKYSKGGLVKKKGRRSGKPAWEGK